MRVRCPLNDVISHTRLSVEHEDDVDVTFATCSVYKKHHSDNRVINLLYHIGPVGPWDRYQPTISYLPRESVELEP